MLNKRAVPRHLTTYEWLFEDKTYSPLHRFPESELGGYHNAVTKETLNWREVKEAATYLSTALVKKYGLKEGDTVSLFSQNTIWYPVAMHATLRVGGKISGASPAYNVEEMTYALEKADAKFLMTHPNSMEVAVEAAKNAGIPRERLFLLEGELKGYKNVKDLIEEGKREREQVPYWKIPEGKTNFDVCGFLSFSSGTTGLPKAVRQITMSSPPRFVWHVTGSNNSLCRS
jgi:acyl-coenzyme A synthetase/AMP-(fatty) acid ligase